MDIVQLRIQELNQLINMWKQQQHHTFFRI
jgi:hypothetical protein